MPNKNSELILWILVIFSAALSIAGVIPSASAYVAHLGILGTLARLVFAAIHGSQRLGWRNLGVMFLIACVVSWCYESLSIATGFPFGHYVYTSELGPKLGQVPLMIMPAYFGVCYLSWVIAHVLLDKFDRAIDSRLIIAVPVIASFVMVMWDMSIDPLTSTLKHEWIWRDGGSYFGVPFSNFLGWFLCVFTIFEFWAIYLIRTKSLPNTPADQDKSGWYLPIAFYGVIFLGSIATAITATNGTVTDAASQVWSVKALNQTLGLVSIFSMLFVTCLAFFKVKNNDSLH